MDEKSNSRIHNAHSISLEELFKKLECNAEGLSEQEAHARHEKYGRNVLKDRDRKPVFKLIIRQFNNVLIYILFIAVGISIYLGNMIDAYLILSIIVINAIIGFIQEYRAELSIAALKHMIVQLAHVLRDGKLQDIDARELVQGDIIELNDGDRIPADARIIQSKDLRTIEASLTGESVPVNKEEGLLEENTQLADRQNMLWMGTFIAGGSAKAVVCNTGANTAIGDVAGALHDIKRSNAFNRKIRRLGWQLGAMASLGALLTFIAGYFIRKIELTEIILFTIASLVAGIPEGLPAVIAIVLAVGARRMADQNALIRTLPATETLGHASIIATDKTGTLTENAMTIKFLKPFGFEDINVSGNGWEFRGALEFNSNSKYIEELIYWISQASPARVEFNTKENQYKVIGDPTEAALYVLCQKAKNQELLIDKYAQFIKDFPFEKDLRLRARVVKEADSKSYRLICYGAPEALLQYSTSCLDHHGEKILSAGDKEYLLGEIERFAAMGLRVLSISSKVLDKIPQDLDAKTLDGMSFGALIAMMDPPREGVRESIAMARSAGIRVLMKTGDHKKTALAIARDTGLIDENVDAAYDDRDLSEMDEEELGQVLENSSVFARLTPATKLRCISNLQNGGHIIAMTGDGVNDAPALKKADIGIAMGKSGTDVARNAADMVLADDNFSTIIKALKEGRVVFRNIRLVTTFLITTNLAEDVTIILSLLLGYELPLLPAQILWLNLITDGLVVLALAVEPGTEQIMKQKPGDDRDKILHTGIIGWLLLMIVVMSFTTIYTFDLFLAESVEKARTGAFVVLAISQLFNVMNMRSSSESIFQVGLFSNKYVMPAILLSVIPVFILVNVGLLSSLFRFEALSLAEWIILIGLSSLVLVFGEIYKLIYRKIKENA